MPIVDKSKGQQDRILTIDDEKNRLLELRHMELVPPEVGIFDEPTRCYRINLEWAKIVMGMVGWLAEVAVWRDAQHEGYSAIESILLFKQGVDCVAFQLRQNETNACLIEQSTDGGETWTTAFDLSLCTSIVDGASETSINTYNNTTNNNFNDYIQIFTENVYNNYVENYVDSITDIHPELGYGDSDDEFRDAALCYALEQLIQAICDAANLYYDADDQTVNTLQTALVLAGVLASMVVLASSGLGIPAAAAMVPYAAMLATGVGILGTGVQLYELYQGYEQAAFNDETAKADLLCCLYDELKGINADQSDLVDALTQCADVFDGMNAEAIAGNGALMFGELALYAAFAENLAIGFNSAKLGLLPSCPCEAPAPTDFWMIYQDFEAGVGPWWDLQVGNLESDGIISEANGATNIVHLRMELDAVFQAKAAGTATKRRGSSGNGGGDFDRIRAYPEADLGGTPQDIAYQAFINCNTDDCGTQEHVFGGGTQPCRSIWAVVSDNGTFNASTNYVKLTKIVVYGLCNTGQIKPAQAVYVDAIPLAGEFFD